MVLALFRGASVQENQSIAKSMKKYQNDTSFDHSVQQMPAIIGFAQLIDLFGPDSWVLFKLIDKNPVFLCKPALWEKDESCIRIKPRFLRLKVVKDSSKRALSLVTE